MEICYYAFAKVENKLIAKFACFISLRLTKIRPQEVCGLGDAV